MNTPDEAAANLAFATKLHEQTMIPEGQPMDMVQNDGNSTQNAPETAQKPKAEKLPQKDNEFESKVLDELSSLKAEVESLLKDEKVEDKNEESTQKDDTGEKE